MQSVLIQVFIAQSLPLNREEPELPLYWLYVARNLYHCTNRAGGIGPADPVLAGPVFSQGKSKIPFLQKASNKQSASVILRLIRLIILSYNR